MVGETPSVTTLPVRCAIAFVEVETMAPASKKLWRIIRKSCRLTWPRQRLLDPSGAGRQISPCEIKSICLEVTNDNR
jgi:hypothetical protein